MPSAIIGRDEFVAAAEMVAAVGRLITVVELLRQIIRGIGVQHGGARIFNRPDDAVGSSVRGNAGQHAGISERRAGLDRRGGKLSVGDREGFQSCALTSQ